MRLPWLIFTSLTWRDCCTALFMVSVICLASLPGSVFCASLYRVTTIRSRATSLLTSARSETWL
ncbi:hypothetical protein D3C79_1035750 [compost metagenome]